MAKRTFLCALMVWMVGALSAQTIYDVTAAGAVGDGKTDDAKAIQQRP